VRLSAAWTAALTTQLATSMAINAHGRGNQRTCVPPAVLAARAAIAACTTQNAITATPATMAPRSPAPSASANAVATPSDTR
jgi:hypothetical protein